MTLALIVAPLLALATQQTPARVAAELSADRARVGEEVVLEVTVETSGETPEAVLMPSLPRGIDAVSSRDFSSVQFSFPGGRSRLLRREIVLRPLRTGVFEIQPFTVRVGGRAYRTRPLKLTVTGGALAQPLRAPNDEVVLRAAVTPDTAYVGQQITYRAEALFSPEARIRLRRAPDYEPPAPSGFWVQDLPDADAVGARAIGSDIYEIQTFNRAFFPLSAGTIVIPPARLLYEVRRGFLNAPESHTLETAPVRVNVRPLPQTGRPSSFTGAVGSFTLSASLQPREIAAGEAATLRVTVDGEGNIKALPPPKLPELRGVEVFAPVEDAAPVTSGGVVHGRKTFSWVLIPESTGRLEIPPIEYGYFDPGSGSYEVVQTAPLALEVTPPFAGIALDSQRAALAPLRPEPSGPPALQWVRHPLFAALQAVPLFALGLLLLRRRRAARPKTISRAARVSIHRGRLGELDLSALAPRDALHEIETVVCAALADLGIPRIGPDVSQFRERVAAAGYTGILAERIVELVSGLRAARYRPAEPEPEDVTRYYRDAMSVLDALAEVRPAGAGRARMLLFALGAGTAGIAGGALAAQSDFQAGVSAYDAGDFTAAGAALRRFAAAQPHDANAWYNLGNAEYQAGAGGKAVLAWARALRLDPRHDDARHNLDVAQAGPLLIRRAAPLPLRTEELLLIAGLAWWLSAAAAAAFIMTRRRGSATAGLAALVVALGAVGAAALPGLRGETAVVTAAQASLLSDPSIRAEQRSVLGEAEPLLVIERRGGWIRVRSLEGTEGWVEGALAPTL